jgi:membrane protein YdbS with pleckstrin-like domain
MEKFRPIFVERCFRHCRCRGFCDASEQRLAASERPSSYILLLLVAPILMALGRYLETKSKIYELTTERLKTTAGVFGKVTDTLGLYRVKDLETRQPFLYRFVGIENVQVNTSDATSPFVLLQAIPCAVALGDKIRNRVEAIRAQKGVREIDVE